MGKLLIVDESATTKVMQIFNFIVSEINDDNIKFNTQLLSITVFSKMHNVSRDTVEKAYKKLVHEGYVKAIKGIGNFVLDKRDKRTKVLLLFNKLSSYKKIIYYAFLETLGENVRVDLHIHHYSSVGLEEIIRENLGNYHYYAVMPHFFHGVDEGTYLPVLKSIPSERLLILDKKINLDFPHKSVFQDFKLDIYDALHSSSSLTTKYDNIIVVFPKHSHHPTELNEGVKKYCCENNKQFAVISETEKKMICPGSAYIVLTESDLAILIKQCRELNYELGKDIGILSFNETVFKELLDITVVTTDFEEMGKSAAKLIINNHNAQIRNPFYLIKRSSL